MTDSHLRKVGLGDLVVETLANVEGRPSGAWTADGAIVLMYRSNILRVPSSGGEPKSLRGADSEGLEAGAWSGDEEYLHPSLLPDGKHFFYLARDYADAEAKRELRVGSLEGGDHKSIMRTNSSAILAPSGELVWWQDGNLRAQTFDVERLELTGESRVLVGGVQFDPRMGLGGFSISNDGTLVYREGGVVRGDELARIDRTGKDLGPIGPPGNFYHPKLSPDGKLVAVDQSDETNRGDIWIFDVERGTGRRFTSALEDESQPVWSPDGSRIAFFSARKSADGAVHARSLRGIDDETVLYSSTGGGVGPNSWATGFIVVDYGLESTDLGSYSVADGAFQPLIETRFEETGGALSPDGRFLAYESDETGRREVYIQLFPASGDRWRASTDGGSGPFWRSDGRELYFMTEKGELMMVPVEAAEGGSVLTLGEPKALFSIQLKRSARSQIHTIDGETFIVNRAVGELESTPLTLVVGAVSH